MSILLQAVTHVLMLLAVFLEPITLVRLTNVKLASRIWQNKTGMSAMANDRESD